MAVYHNYVVVIGRVPGDDESTLVKFEQMTDEEARSAFADERVEARRDQVTIHINRASVELHPDIIGSERGAHGSSAGRELTGPIRPGT